MLYSMGKDSAVMLHLARDPNALGNWSWSIEPNEGDPLHPDAPHWQSQEGTMVFEPGTRGGLGASPVVPLIHAGLLNVGHFCMRKDGESVLVETTEELVCRHGQGNRQSGIMSYQKSLYKICATTAVTVNTFPRRSGKLGSALASRALNAQLRDHGIWAGHTGLTPPSGRAIERF